MLQIIFGDDEHTAADGPYSRLMKTRKWVYLTAAFASVLGLHLYDEEAANSILRVVDLPWWLMSQAALGGLVYLSIQYGFLIRQLMSSYDIILAERLAFRRAEELASAQERLENRRAAVIDRYEAAVIASRSTLQKVRADRAELRRSKDKLVLEMKRFEDAGFTSADHEKQRQNTERLADIERGIVSLDEMEALTEENRSAAPPPPNVEDDPEVIAAQAELDLLRSQNPAARSGYRQSEIAIDAIRLTVPIISALVAGTGLAIAILHAR